MNERIAIIPKFGDYTIPMNILLEQCLGCKTLECPLITKRTVEIGAKHSPDTVCTPFKVITGNFIESLDLGANTLVMPGFGCRLGFYDMLHKQILGDLGYKFDMVVLCDYTANSNRIFNSLSTLNPDLTRESFDKIFSVVCKIVIDMDIMAALVRKNSGFEIEKGSHERLYKEYLQKAKKITTLDKAIELGEEYTAAIKNVKINKPSNYLRIGIVGDLYTVIEPHGNCELEKWLVNNGVEINRPTDLTFLAGNIFSVDKMVELSGGYIDYGIGGNANCTVMQAYQMLENKEVDGVIHIKAATCSPEISAMSILADLSADYGIPFMYLTFDTETGDAGLHTRLEAFCDMLLMRPGK